MSEPAKVDFALERRLSARLMDVYTRAHPRA